MEKRWLVISIVVYKTLINLARIWAGIFLIKMNFDMERVIRFIIREEIDHPKDWLITYLGIHLREASQLTTGVLAFALIILSLVELYFVINLLKEKRSGALGLLITTLSWIPIEILFISKFIITKHLGVVIINLLVIFALYKIVKHTKEYFKR